MTTAPISEKFHTHTDKKAKNMRTKTILLSGILAALSGVSLMAQVYSLNAVGYINVTCGQLFTIVADQLYASNAVNGVIPPNYISPLLDAQLLDGNHDGVEIFKYNNGSYTTLAVQQVTGQPAVWSEPSLAQTTTINPGESVFFYNPYSTNMTLTFVGTVPQGSLTNTALQPNTLANGGFSMVSTIVPFGGAIDSVLGLNQTNVNIGDEVFVYNPTAGEYASYSTVLNSGIFSWQPNPPVLAVGQGFFYFTLSKSGVNWVQNFSVNP